MSTDARWLLLIHNSPPKPNYFRVKIWRKLGALGAVAIKNSVYVLPKTDSSHESFQWLSREIIQGGGEAAICEAMFVEGLADAQIEAMFNKARNKDYEELADAARAVSKKTRPKLKDDARREIESELVGLKQKLSGIVALDYFGASGRESTDGLINEIEAKLLAAEPGAAVIGQKSIRKEDLQGRVWVTRRGIHVDRIASAWLIRRFIDARASFKYVDGKSYTPKKGELRFDMFEAEFTHEGDLCTFEVLIQRTNLSSDESLRQIGQIIHNIDLRDDKHQREDVKGIEQVINGICMAHKSDEERLARGTAVFDDLYEYFKRKRR